MAIDKNKLIRFFVIDKCLRNRSKHYFLDDPKNEGFPNLLDECNAILREKELPLVSRRTIYYDINEIEEIYKTEIERIPDGRRTYYRYSDPNFTIEHAPISDDEMHKLQETILMLNRFRSQFPWMEDLLTELQTKFHIDGHTESIIGFENDEYIEGREYIEPLFQYILNKQAIKVVYKPFGKSEISWILHPYYIKQYNNRWFLFALNEEMQKITNIPLDRIISIEPAKKRYIPNTDIDFNEYFDDVVGVTIPNGQVETITLQFSSKRFPYELSKAIHPSRVIRDKEKGIIEIKVIPNKELISQLLWFGEDVEVLSPESIRDQLKAKIEQMHKKYEQKM